MLHDNSVKCAMLQLSISLYLLALLSYISSTLCIYLVQFTICLHEYYCHIRKGTNKFKKNFSQSFWLLLIKYVQAIPITNFCQ